MRYICSLKQLQFHAYHGLYAEEHLTGGTFIVDISIESERHPDDHLNTLESVLDYETVFNLVSDTMKEREDLIEAVAKKIIDRIHSHFTHIERIEVTITKPNPAGLFKSGAAVVTLIR